MEVQYKKDLRYNYMIIAKDEARPVETYCIRMLEQQSIKGILPVDQRLMDNQILFYYDITAKQSMINLLDRTALSYDKVRQLLIHILGTLEKAYDYLLPEDDFILTPEYIYMDITTNCPYLCYLSGYQKSMREQMKGLIEYLMNKVDYNDKEAVLFVYQLYAVSKEEGFAFEQLLEVLQKDLQAEKNQTRQKEGYSENQEEEKQQISNNTNLGKSSIVAFSKSVLKRQETSENITPVMIEKIEGEEENPCYPLKTYIYTGGCIVAGLVIIFFVFFSKILYNDFGNRIDYSKLFAFFLMLFCSEGYIIRLVWDKKNKITKLINKQEYIDPRQDSKITNNIKKSKEKAPEIINRSKEQDNQFSINVPRNKNEEGQLLQRNLNTIVEERKSCFLDANRMDELEEDNPTCLLNETVSKSVLILKSLQEDNYKDISIIDFPFFIGKLKKNVDYCLEKQVISRFHAKITKEDQKYFITDLNSTNGTFVNNESLQTYQKKEIIIGDEIAFADIKYRVQ